MNTTEKENARPIVAENQQLTTGGGKSNPPRESNLELLRIFAMLAIIAHHSIVNSGVINKMNLTSPAINEYFLAVWGMWGKTAINSFILISGYFLCKSNLTWQRYLKLLIEIYFYKIVIMSIFMLSGYQEFSLVTIGKSLIEPLRGVNNGFTASFLAFYMFVPIYNRLTNALDERTHRLMLIGLYIYLTVASTLFFAKSMNEPFWYATLYMTAAYIRLYPNKWTESSRVAWTTLICSVLLSILSVISILFVFTHPAMFHLPESITANFMERAFGLLYWFVSDSNKILALAVGLSAFLVAKNAKKFYSNFINWLAAGTFAVLLIHASSNTMRQWLWQDILNIPSLATASISKMLLVTLLSPIVIFLVCSTIDHFRRIWIEKPMMKWLNGIEVKKF